LSRTIAQKLVSLSAAGVCPPQSETFAVSWVQARILVLDPKRK